jgi:uncharacterized membrane protein YjgN (DUF898 family)
MSKKISFTGSFWEYFIISLGLIALSSITLGLALPYLIYWSVKYFFSKLEIDGKRIVFTGGFWEYFLISLGLLLLTFITLGLAQPYWSYWSLKYFFTKMEIQE